MPDTEGGGSCRHRRHFSEELDIHTPILHVSIHHERDGGSAVQRLTEPGHEVRLVREDHVDAELTPYVDEPVDDITVRQRFGDREEFQTDVVCDGACHLPVAYVRQREDHTDALVSGRLRPFHPVSVDVPQYRRHTMWSNPECLRPVATICPERFSGGVFDLAFGSDGPRHVADVHTAAPACTFERETSRALPGGSHDRLGQPSCHCDPCSVQRVHSPSRFQPIQNR